MSISLQLLPTAELNILRPVIAFAVGALVGLERGARGRDAGVRTHALVALGSAVFTLVGVETVGHGAVDASRIAAQVVSGIGWLGAGVIIRQPSGRLSGLTSAVTLWAVAALGMAVADGLYTLSGVSVLLALFANGPLRRLSKRESIPDPMNNIVVELRLAKARAAALKAVLEAGVKVETWSLEKQVLTIEPAAATAVDSDAVCLALSSVPDVKKVTVPKPTAPRRGGRGPSKGA